MLSNAPAGSVRPEQVGATPKSAAGAIPTFGDVTVREGGATTALSHNAMLAIIIKEGSYKVFLFQIEIFLG